MIIFNHEPYDNTDVIWNGLHLAKSLIELGQEVRIFLMNYSVDLARDVCKPPENSNMSELAQLVVTSEKVLTF